MSSSRGSGADIPLRSRWPRFPSIYEINTWVWLGELARKAGAPVDLGSVSPDEWDRVAAMGFDAVWFMGVWERSPAGIAVANRNEGLLSDFRRALPDFRIEDNVGSPYCIRRYVVDPHLGGPAGLAQARKELARRGLRLLLDFVPNHVAPDHPWVVEHPEYFIQGTLEDARNDPGSFHELHGTVFACGRDPYFPAWSDVLQLHAFEPSLRAAVRTTLLDLATQCDGVRCDMAMLMLNGVFERTWAGRAGTTPATDYWPAIIPAIKQAHPAFLFIAEAYWGREWELQQQGFDFCYDKTLYDRLEHDDAENVRLHLCAEREYQDRLVRFIENHDEPRAASAFHSVKARAVAVVVSTLAGARLLHEGQFEGRRVRLPVFLARRPDEAPDPDLKQFYEKLLSASSDPAFRDGRWRLCERSGWADNHSYLSLVAWSWEHGDDRYLIVVNLSDRDIQARVRVEWDGVAGGSWRLHDRLTGATYERAGDDLASGLYVELGAWSAHLFECEKRKTS
jgi:Alpha amylase, catalytic domain